MEKLTSLSTKEASGEQELDGLYRVTVDLRVSADKKWNVETVKELVKTMGDVEDVDIQKHLPTNSFRTGDVVELVSDYACEKDIFLDSQGNLVITDYVSDNVEKVGTYAIVLSAGAVAEVNKTAINDKVELLFAGDSIIINDKRAYLGIIELPSNIVIRYSGTCETCDTMPCVCEVE